MAHITMAQLGLAALDDKNWDEAANKLSVALKSSENPAWLIGRSRALAGLNRYPEALEDADLAWHRAHDRSARHLMSEAHYRRAIAHFSLGQHANADACCIYAMRMIKGHPAVEKMDPALEFVGEDGLWTARAGDAMTEAQQDELNRKDRSAINPSAMRNEPQTQLWRMASTTRMHVLNAMDKLPKDDAGRKLSVRMKPELKKLADISSSSDNEGDNTTTITQPAPSKPPVPRDVPLRTQDFQNNTTMTVSIFSKSVNKDQLVVEFLPYKVRLGPIVYPNGDEKDFTLDPWGEIDPSTSKVTVTPNKVELSLMKKVAGKWPTLQADDALKVIRSTNPEPDPAASLAVESSSSEPATSKTDVQPQASTNPPTAATAPTYPTSSASGPKNWDKVGADEGSDDEKDVNHFFKQLYKNATPEQQRAMMKSFTESNGTSLSTDWNDVKNRKVETVPPEGVLAKKWE